MGGCLKGNRNEDPVCLKKHRNVQILLLSAGFVSWLCQGLNKRSNRFNCRLSVVYLDKGDYPENLHAVFCPNKQRSFEPFMCRVVGVCVLQQGEDDIDCVGISVHVGCGLAVCCSMFECCVTSTETGGLLGTGALDGHLDFDTAPEHCCSMEKMTVFIKHFCARCCGLCVAAWRR